MNHKKSIFDYNNYREFLKDAYLNSKRQNKNFSFRYFSKRAGFSSPNFLKVVMEGKRNLSPDGVEKFAIGFKLNKRETAFFKLLVQFEQSKTPSEKQSHAQEILNFKKFKESHPLSAAQFNYYANWYFAAVRALVELPGFKEDPKWIASHVQPEITEGEAAKALEELQLIGLLNRDNSGRLKLSEEHITSGDEVSFSGMAQYHRQMMKRASESIDTVTRDKRDISAVTFGISEEMAKKVKVLIQKFRNELVEFVSKDEANPESIYQLNLQFFPLSVVCKGDPKK